MPNVAINALPIGQAVGVDASTQLTFPANGALRVANAAGTSYFDLVAEAANTIAVRNGTNVPELRIYKNYTDAANNSGIKIDGNGLITTFKNGTSSDPGVSFKGLINVYHVNSNIGVTANRFSLDGTTPLFLGSGIPTADPAQVGRVWNDGGTLKISASPPEPP